MKKTLVTLLVVALLISAMGTVSFAADTEMTPIPDAPELTQQYVHLQADGTVKTPGYEAYAEKNTNYHRGVEAVCASCGKNHCPTSNIAYNDGYFSRVSWQNTGIGEGRARRYASYSTGSSANGIGTSRYGYHRWNDAGNNDTINNMVELAFETLGSDIGTETTADSGYLMLHNDKVLLNANYASFGFGLVSGDLIGGSHGRDMKDDYLYVAVVLEGNDTDGWKSYLQFLNTRHTARGSNWGWGAGGQYRQLEITEYVKKDKTFDIKVLANLDTDTYGIYIDNRPVVLSCFADTVSCPAIGGINLAITMVNEGEAKFGTTSCYPVTESDANQFMQASWERAFNGNAVVFKKSWSNDTFTGIPLFTAWAGSDVAQWAPEQGHFYEIRWKSENVDKGFNTKCILKHEGLTGLNFYDKTDVGESYSKYYLRADNMQDYDYDKLDMFMLCGNPAADAVTGVVEGKYIAAGGLGMQKLPRVISAAYTKDGEYEALADAEITEAPYGVYKADFSNLNIPDEENVKLVHYIWGGNDKLTPLFDAQVLQDFIQQ